MAQPLMELVEQFCTYQRKQKGKTEGGVRAYRWMLGRFLAFVRKREGRLGEVRDVNAETIQAWMDDMAGADLAVGSMRVRQSALSSLCACLAGETERGAGQSGGQARSATPSKGGSATSAWASADG